MNRADVNRIHIPRPARKRVGRGWGSGLGKTSTRGEKGAGRRSGTRFRLRFEGGQMPLYRRLPKKGFSNSRYRVDYEVVNAGDLEASFEAGAKVDLEALRAARLVPKSAKRLKILGDGDLAKALHVTADAASAGARAKIEAAGGTLTLPPAALARAAERAERAERAARARTAAAAAPAEAAEPAPKKKKGSKDAPAEGEAAEGGAAKAAKAPKAPKAPKDEKDGQGEKGAKPQKPRKDGDGAKGGGGARS